MLHRLIAGVLVAMAMAVTGPARASLVWDFAFESPELTANGTVVFTGPESEAGDQIESFLFEGLFFGAPVMLGTPDITQAYWVITPELVLDFMYIEAVETGQIDLLHSALSLQIFWGEQLIQPIATVSCLGTGCAPIGFWGLFFDLSPVHEEAVPEPSTLWIFSLGLVIFLLMALRTRRAAGGRGRLVHRMSGGARPSPNPTAA